VCAFVKGAVLCIPESSAMPLTIRVPLGFTSYLNIRTIGSCERPCSAGAGDLVRRSRVAAHLNRVNSKGRPLKHRPKVDWLDMRGVLGMVRRAQGHLGPTRRPNSGCMEVIQNEIPVL